MTTASIIDDISPETDRGGDGEVQTILARLEISERLMQAELVDLPVSGPGSPLVRPQARDAQADALTPEGLRDLISSIGVLGQLQAIIVEEVAGELTLLAGERRLSAFRLGAVEYPDNPHFAKGTVRASVVPGPLSEWERRAVQLAENFARRDLTDTDIARALWYGRCALFTERAQQLGLVPPDDVKEMGDPVARWERLEEWRTTVPELHNVGANWEDTRDTLGLSLSETRLKEISRAMRTFGADLSERFDDFGASHRARKAARNVKKSLGSSESVERILDLVAEKVEVYERDGIKYGNPSRLLEEAYGLKLSSPEMPDEQVVATVVTEMVEQVADGILAGAGGALVDQHLGIESDVGMTFEAEGGGGPAMSFEGQSVDDDEGFGDAPQKAASVARPVPADVSALLARLREVEGLLRDKAGPHLEHLEAELDQGRAVSPGDMDSLKLLCAGMERFSERVQRASEGR